MLKNIFSLIFCYAIKRKFTRIIRELYRKFYRLFSQDLLFLPNSG